MENVRSISYITLQSVQKLPHDLCQFTHCFVAIDNDYLIKLIHQRSRDLRKESRDCQYESYDCLVRMLKEQRLINVI